MVVVERVTPLDTSTTLHATFDDELGIAVVDEEEEAGPLKERGRTIAWPKAGTAFKMRALRETSRRENMFAS